MFCPRCAAHNIDDAKYCRVCGADISLLPQVLSGQLTVNPDDAGAPDVDLKRSKRRRRDKDKDQEKDKPPTLEKAFENIGVGIAFLLISIIIAIFMPGGRFWWYWMLIPALACAGEGIGQLLRVKREKAPGTEHKPLFPSSRANEARHLPPRNTSEIMMPPPSITEHTTRHLSAEPLRSKRDETDERPHDNQEQDEVGTPQR